MASFINEHALKWTLFNAAGEDSRLTEANLQEWDQELRNKYESALSEELTRHNISDTIENRSVIVLLAQIGYRLGHKRSARIEKACEYFNRCRDFNLPGESPTPLPA